MERRVRSIVTDVEQASGLRSAGLRRMHVVGVRVSRFIATTSLTESISPPARFLRRRWLRTGTAPRPSNPRGAAH
jgi:hypothetical protein